MVPDEGEPVRLHPGDVAIMRGPDPYILRRRPGDATADRDPSRRALRHPGTARIWPRPWTSAFAPGATTRTARRGCSPAPTRCAGRSAGGCSRRCPRCWSWRRTPGLSLVPLLAAEIVKDEPGQEAVLDRLLDLLLITVLRAWFSSGRPRPRRGIGPTATPWWVRPCGCCSTTRPTPGPWPRWPRGSACPARLWPPLRRAGR